MTKLFEYFLSGLVELECKIRKINFIFVLSMFIITFLLLINKSVFAIGWFQDSACEYHYMTKDGELLRNAIKENPENNFKFYLDDDGNVMKDHLLEDYDDNIYYFNYFGAMATNCWVKVDSENEDNQDENNPEVYYFYFDAHGHAIRGINGTPKKYKIDGNTYLFNENGHVLCGFIDGNGNVIDEYSEDNPYENAKYVTNSDCALISGWYKYGDSYFGNESSPLSEKENIYLYFDLRNFEKVGFKGACDKAINHEQYSFSDKGVLLTGFDKYDLGISSDLEYRRNGEDFDNYKAKNDDNDGLGALIKKAWVYTEPAMNDPEYTDEEKSEKHWFYYDRKSELIKNAVRKINTKYYAFDEKGIMKTGMVAFLDGTIMFVVDMDETTGEDIMKKGKYTYYGKDGVKHYLFTHTYLETSGKYKYSTIDDYYDPEDPSTASFYYETADKEMNILRNFMYTGRCDTLGFTYEDLGLYYYDQVKFYYFGDDGALKQGKSVIKMADADYVYGQDRMGHYQEEHGKEYFYNGFKLAADKDIGLGLYVVEPSMQQSCQKHVYDLYSAPVSFYDEENATTPKEYNNYQFYKERNCNAVYKVLNSNGKLVKGKDSSYKDKLGNYWYIDKKTNDLYGIYSTPIKNNTLTVTLKTILDKKTCPSCFVSGTEQDMIDYFGEFDWTLTEPCYTASITFAKDFKDYYCFYMAGKIKGVSLDTTGLTGDKFRVKITYTGLTFKSVLYDKNQFVPFGMRDDGRKTATVFSQTNDYMVLPDSDDYFCNGNWYDDDAIDMVDGDRDGLIDDGTNGYEEWVPRRS